MSIVLPLVTISVGVLMERTKGSGPWAEFNWCPVSVLIGAPDTPPWSKLSDDGARAIFYAGAAEIELYRTETQYYRDNLGSGMPHLWVVLEATDAEPPYRVTAVTADPAECESLTEAATALVECVPMPQLIQEILAAFVAEHHVEQPFIKRQRDRADPEALARGMAQRGGRKP